MLSALKYDERFPSTDMFGDMESEIAELRTMTRVTKLRRQIETRQEGAWMSVRDVPDDRSSSGTRKVTTYGRATRSVTRSFTSDVNLNDFLSSTTTKDNFKEPSNEAIVEFPEELPRSTHQPPKSDVEITEVVDNEPEPTYGVPIKTSPTKKTSVVTLGQGNVVLIDPQDSNFKVTGMSKGVAGEEPSSKSGIGPKLSSKSEDSKKVKKVGFCKTEVHFAPDSGKVNIVETDEKPPSSQVLRRKKKPRKEPHKTSMPKLYFGDMEKQKISAEKSVLIDPRSRTEHVFPVIREPSPLLSTSIANQARSVKEPWSSPEKDDVNYCELSGSEVKTKIGFNSNSEVRLVEKSVPKPSFNGSWSKEGAGFVRNFNLKDDSNCELGGYAEVKGKISFSSNSEVRSVEKGVHLDESDPKPRELNGNWSKEGASFLRNASPTDDADFELGGYGEVKRKISFNSNSEVKSVEKSVPVDDSVPKQFSGSWSKEGANFLRNVSPKLSKLISNNMQHEFQQKQMEILRKSRQPEQQGIVEPGIVVVGGNGVVEGDVPVAVNIHVSSDESQMKVKPVKIVAQVKVSLEERKAKAGPEPKREPVYVNEVKGVTRTINVSREEEKTPKPKSSLTKIVLEEGKERKRTKSITKSATLERVGRKSTTPTTPVRESRPKKDVPKREVAVVKPMKPAKGTLTRPEPCRRSRSASDGLRPLKAPKDPTKPRGDKTEPAKPRGDKAEPGKSRGDKADSAKSKKSKEPLRSFEKVSNGWVSHIVPVKAAKGSSRVSITTTTVAASAQSVLTSSTSPEMKSDTESSELRNPVTVRVENKFHTRSSLTSAKQFSLSKEHLKSAKLVKDLYRVRSEPKPDVPLPKSQSQRPKPEDWASQRSKSIVSRRRLVYEEGPRHVRRDSEQSDDSVIRADEEVRATLNASEMMDEMTASYSEICEQDILPPAQETPAERPKVLDLTTSAQMTSSQEDRLSRLDGQVMKDGEMISFVADNLETKIKLSSPIAYGEPMWNSRLSEGEAKLLEELEVEASILAASVDSLTENLAETLHGISALTVDSLEVYRDVVCKTCDSVDTNIKAMYQLMAKCEEMSKSMSSVSKLAAHIKHIKHLLDLLEANPS